MPTVEAHIPTDRASRYLIQLCQHSSQMPGMRHRPPTGRRAGHLPPAVQHANWSDTAGTIRFAQGQCTLSATSDTLTVRLNADDQDALRQLQDGVARRLETIGRRDDLTIHWRHTDAAPGARPGEATAATAGPEPRAEASRHRRLIRTLLLVAAVALAIAVHVGLLGSAVATSPWASWGTNIIVAIILLKLIAVAVGGRIAFRHGKAFHGGRKHRQPPSGSAPATDVAAGHATGPSERTEQP